MRVSIAYTNSLLGLIVSSAESDPPPQPPPAPSEGASAPLPGASRLKAKKLMFEATVEDKDAPPGTISNSKADSTAGVKPTGNKLSKKNTAAPATTEAAQDNADDSKTATEATNERQSPPSPTSPEKKGKAAPPPPPAASKKPHAAKRVSITENNKTVPADELKSEDAPVAPQDSSPVPDAVPAPPTPGRSRAGSQVHRKSAALSEKHAPEAGVSPVVAQAPAPGLGIDGPITESAEPSNAEPTEKKSDETAKPLETTSEKTTEEVPTDSALNEVAAPEVKPASTSAPTVVPAPAPAPEPVEKDANEDHMLDAEEAFVYDEELGVTTEEQEYFTYKPDPDPIELTEPSEVDSSLETPVFDPANKEKHTEVLQTILWHDPKKMTVKQRESFTAHLNAFAEHYRDLQVFQKNENLQYNATLIDQVFERMDGQTPCLQAIFPLLVILSRRLREKSPGVGEESRIVKILEVIQKRMSNGDVVREGIRALVNYAEVNAKLIFNNGILDILSSAFNQHSMDERLLVNILIFLRNLTVEEIARAQILDRFAFILANSISARMKDPTIAENGCFVLGNLALLSNAGSMFSSTGIAPAVKNILTTYPDNEEIQEGACWFIYNITTDDNFVKGLVRLQCEAPLIEAVKRFPKNTRILEYADVALRRIRTSIVQNSPAAIAERFATRSLFQGNLNQYTGGFFSSSQKRWVVLQPFRIALYKNEGDEKVLEEITLKELDLMTVDSKLSYRFRLQAGSRSWILDMPDKSSVQAWIKAIYPVWKEELNPITENPNIPELSPPQPLFLNSPLPETLLLKDVEKYCIHHVLHEVCGDPFVIKYQFKGQRGNTKTVLQDYFAVLTTKRIVDDFMKNKLKEVEIPEQELYDAVKLKKILSNTVEEKMLTYLQEFDGNPKNMDDAPKIGTRYEYCAKQGIRPTMEDRHAHVPYADVLVGRDKKEEPVSYFAVYDGHGGTHTAEFIEVNLLPNIMKHDAFETDTKKAIHESFLSTQDDLKTTTDRLNWPTNAGSTAVTILIKGKKMFVSWAGDSLATLYKKDDDYIELINGHKPGKESEKERIEKLGGFVTDENGGIPRVNGAVAVSRAFGNLRHHVIIPEPDITELEITGDEEYMVVACDGLWDVMTSDEVRDFVENYLAKNGKKTRGISEALVDESLNKGSTDNVSVIFVEFDTWKTPKRP